MFKKVMAILLALSMLLCLAACGKEGAAETDGSQDDIPAEESSESGQEDAEPAAEPEGEEPEAAEESAPAETEGEEPEPEEPAETEEPAASDGEKRLDERVAETGPANKFEELRAAYEICQAQLDLAEESAENAGLSGDATLSGLFSDWKAQLGELYDYLKEYEGADEGTLDALDEDPLLLYYVAYFQPILPMLYNMTGAIAEDPALFLERYLTVPESAAEPVECDGSWPEGYFFSDRVPEIEHIDRLEMSATGDQYGFDGGVNYTLYVNEFGEEQARAYMDQLVEAGFRRESGAEEMGAILWYGRRDDSEGHISVAMMYNGNAAGTADSPALTVIFYDYDIIGVMLDIGTIY